MTVKELHDALSMAYWKGVQDFKDNISKKTLDDMGKDFPPLSAADTKEFNEMMNKSCETYIDKLIVQVMSGLKISVR